MDLLRSSSRAAVTAWMVCLWAGPLEAADWARDFNDGTTRDQRGVPLVNQPLPGVPAGEFTTSVPSLPSTEDRSFRMKFAGGGSDGDSGIMLDHDDVFIGPASAKMLIRFSQNPLLVQTIDDSEINAGFILHVQGDFQSYICVLDDRGYLQLQEVQPGLNIEGFPGGSKTIDDHYQTPGTFKPDKDWWIRFEVIPLPPEGVRLRARAWLDGTPEPMCLWMVEAFDTESPLFGGATAIVANEDAAVPDGQNFIDVDNVSVSSTITCVEICGNGLDDDEDGGADCADLECDLDATCACHSPFADFDGDGDVDQADYAQFQLCYTGASAPGGLIDVANCDCFDREDADGNNQFGKLSDGDGDVDADDLGRFLACFSGPSLAAVPSCED